MQLIGRNDARDQSRALGLIRTHHATGQHHIHGFGFTHRTSQALRTARTRNHTELDFRLTKLRGIGGNNRVTTHRQFTAATQCKARNRSNNRFTHTRDLIPIARDEIARISSLEIQSGHCLDIRAGGKRLFTAGNDDRANACVGFKSQQCLRQFIHQRIIECIELLRAVQCNPPNGIQVLHRDILKVHLLSFMQSTVIKNRDLLGSSSSF